MQTLPFDQALAQAQTWVGKNDIYAVGESKDKKGNKIILVFAQDTTKLSDIIPSVFHGHNVKFHDSDEVKAQDIDPNK